MTRAYIVESKTPIRSTTYGPITGYEHIASMIVAKIPDGYFGENASATISALASTEINHVRIMVNGPVTKETETIFVSSNKLREFAMILLELCDTADGIPKPDSSTDTERSAE